MIDNFEGGSHQLKGCHNWEFGRHNWELGKSQLTGNALGTFRIEGFCEPWEAATVASRTPGGCKKTSIRLIICFIFPCWFQRGSITTGNMFSCFPGDLSTNGYRSKLNHQETAGLSPCFHVPGFHFRYIFLTHGQIKAPVSIFPRGVEELTAGARREAPEGDQPSDWSRGSMFETRCGPEFPDFICVYIYIYICIFFWGGEILFSGKSQVWTF